MALPSITALAAGLALSASAPDADALTVARDSVPDLAASERLTARELISLTNAGEMLGEGLSLSPDGRRFAFEAHRADPDGNSYRVAWFVGSVGGSRTPANVGDGGDPALFRNISGGWTAFAPAWSPDGNWIGYRRKVNGAVQIWRSSADGSRQELIVSSPADVIDFIWTQNGTAILFQTDAPRDDLAAAARAEARRGYLVDDSTFNAFYESVPLQPAYRLTGGSPVLWYQDIGGVARRVTAAEQEAWTAAHPVQGRDATVRADRPSRWTSWLEVDDPAVNRGRVPPLALVAAPRRGTPIRCSLPQCVGRLTNLGPTSSGEVVFLRVDDGRRSLLAWRPGSRSVRTILRTEDWLSSCGLAEAEAICFVESPVRPRRVVAIGLGSGAIRTLAEPNPRFARFRLGATERIDWTNASGRAAWGYLVRPVDYRPGVRYPLIITSYNAQSCLRGNTGDEFPTHLFSASGFMVLCFNEFSVNPEMEAREPDPMRVFAADYRGFVRQRNILSALEAAIDLLDRRGLVDRRRVGLAGLSAGAEMVQYALIHSRSFAAAAVPTLAFNPIGYFGTTATARRDMLGPIGLGDPARPDGSRGWRQLATAMHVGDLPPLLVQAADREFLYAMETAVRAFDAGMPFEMMVYPDEHHVKFQPAHRLSAYERYVDWFSFWLRGVEDSGPLRAGQYVRWRAMRGNRCRLFSGAAGPVYCGSDAARSAAPDAPAPARDTSAVPELP